LKEIPIEAHFDKLAERQNLTLRMQSRRFSADKRLLEKA
jgi:hypothetical protein